MTIRQDTRPIEFESSIRPDYASIITSGKAGVVIPVSFIPHHRGETAGGSVSVTMALAEMPAPTENAVVARVQAWFVPRPALPQFSGLDEYTHAYHGTDITALGASNRTPPSLFSTVASGAIAAANTSELFTACGLYLQAAEAINTDYIDSYVLVHNFRLAAHSSKMTRGDYYSEDATTSLELKPAFWPRNRMHQIVPDYERALVVGSLDLDIAAGQLPISGIGIEGTASGTSTTALTHRDTDQDRSYADGNIGTSNSGASLRIRTDGAANTTVRPEIFAEMANQTIPTTLAAIDRARTTNAFAKRVAQMEGSNFSGFNNDDVVMAELMQGFVVPNELMNRPWLIDSQTVVFGMQERHATDAANLDDSVVTGQAQVTIPYNVPVANYGGVGMITVEVMPERLYERQSDEYLYCTTVDDLPNQMRDAQREEPVDVVLNRRVDAAHTTPAGTFGYEPMNAKWRRERTTVGGEFRQLTPGTPSTNSRTQIWQADYVDPVFTSDHWLCPHPFPQTVFSVPANDIVNISVRQDVTFVTPIQFGDELVEDNGEFLAVEAEQI
jgi:hypothetical protein